MTFVQPQVIARLENEHAHVTINGRSLSISRSDEDGRGNFCPVELVSAALGS